MAIKNVFDDLKPPVKNEQKPEQDQEPEDKIIIPAKCTTCKVLRICSVIPFFSHIANIGILIQVESCPFDK